MLLEPPVTFKRTYEIESPPAAPMTWQEYERLVLAGLDDLLGRVPSPSEAQVHAFLERHPCLVPGAFNITGLSSGHYPAMAALVSRPPLPSYDRRVPDFMWLSTNSAIDEPVLIELEAPRKRWFTKAGDQTAHLTEALGQIAEWKAWMGVPRNVEAFKAFYRLDRSAWQKRRFRPAYALIYGRRVEASATPELTQKRGHLHADDIISMTFDRLSPDPKADQTVCVKAVGTGKFLAIAVPPTLKWSPMLAADRAVIGGLEAAIEANPHIVPERKEFLIRRLEYWNQWAGTEPHGIIGSGDAE